MSLQLFYTPEDDAIFLSSAIHSDFGVDLPNDCNVVVRHPEDEYDPVELEVLGISTYLPLETNGGYCAETDTLTFGVGKAAATLIAENDDLIAYWQADPGSPDELELMAVDLRNASRHLSSVIEAVTVPARR